MYLLRQKVSFGEADAVHYQMMNSIGNYRYELIIYEQFHFEYHLHRFLELAYVLEGELMATINGRECAIRAGEMAFIFPNFFHSYRTPQHSRVAMFIVSNEFLPSFTKKIENREADSYVFRPSQPVRNFFDSMLLDRETPNELQIKAAFYAVADAFLQSNALSEAKTDAGDVTHRMLSYVSENYRENITLKSMARDLGYDSHYLSRRFNAALNINFRHYLNLYRVDRACMLLHETDRDITSIALESGFQNLRSFNRAFLRVTNEQPAQYRRNH